VCVGVGVSNCCDLETSTMMWPQSDLSCCAAVKNHSNHILKIKMFAS